MDVQENTSSGSYDAVVDDHVVGMVVYRKRDGGRVIFTHTVVDDRYRGRGVGSDLVKRALDDIANKGLTLTNYCPFVADYIADHPEYKLLVDDRHPGSAAVPDRAPRDRES